MLESVEWADWVPDGQGIAVVRQVGLKRRLEMPPDHVVYETGGAISHPRVSPRGDLVAFFDHYKAGDSRGSVAVVDLKGRARRLSPGWEALEGLAWNAAGTEIWFTGATSGTAFALHAVDLNGRTRLV